MQTRSRRLVATVLGIATMLLGIPVHSAVAEDGISAAASTGSGARGYWLVAGDGGVFSFGEAKFHGSTGAIRLNRPIVGMASGPRGAGYWLVASDGGIFAFGESTFHGSTGAMRLAQPIVGMAATPTGRGYWLLARDGGVFNFGDAGFLGSGAGGSSAFVSMAATATGRGYWLASVDGTTVPFGDAPALGSVGRLAQPIVGAAAAPQGDGGWLIAADGGVFTLGSALFYGSTGAMRLVQPIVTGAASLGGGTATPAAPAPLAPAPAPAAPAPAAAYMIALIGDTGYSANQDDALLTMRSEMAGYPLAFVVHDGDIQAQTMPCTDERLRYVRGVFDGFAAPFIYTPGDNEWKDCDNPDERLAAIRRIFFSTDESLGKTRIPLQRQHPEYVENARWTRGGVYYATLNVPGPRGSGVSTDVQVAWLNGTFDAAQASGAPAVVITWQDNPFELGTNAALLDTLKRRTKAFRRPVVLVHGDTHDGRINNPWGSEVPNFTRVETYHGSSGTWVRATVDPASPKVFTFEVMQ